MSQKHQILTPEQVLAAYHPTHWVKTASTRIKIIDEADVQKETSFLDLEGRRHEVRIGRCLCIGPQDERWTCSVESLERDRYPITDEDAEGYREYKMKHPRPVRCFEIPFPFVLRINGEDWRCDDVAGGMITWNGKIGDRLVMRVIARSAFLLSYSRRDGTMTPTEYQEKALRSLAQDLSVKDRLALCGLGLSGELGEVTDLLKKHLYHRNGMPLDIDKMRDELGDVMWYFSVLLDTLGLSFEDVMEANVAKLEKRHPNGFVPKYASDSHASE